MSTITAAIDPTINGTLTSTIWTDTTTATKPSFWIHPDSGDMYIPATTKGTITLNAQARVNKSTLADRELAAVMASVKHKLLKQLFEQLEKTGAVKITSIPSDKTGAITFHARLELVPQNDKA